MFVRRSESCEFESHQDSGDSDLKTYKIGMCISHPESLCDRDYSPDPLDKTLG